MNQTTQSRQRLNTTVIWFILPTLIGMLCVHYIPIIWGVFISFLDLDIFTLTQWVSAPFVGLGNYISVLNSEIDVGHHFLRSIWNVIFYGLITIPGGYIIGLAVALLMNQKFPCRTLARSLILLPYITPDSVAYNVWRFIFQARIGLINKYLLSMGLIKEPLIWLVGDRGMVPVIIASLWKGWPFACLILLAGRQSIPDDLYEAAWIDGASRWKQFWNITMPMLLPISGTLLLLSAIWNFYAFNQFYVLLGRHPGIAAEVPSTFIMREAFTNLHYGLGSAMAVIVALLVLIFTALVIFSRRKEDNSL